MALYGTVYQSHPPLLFFIVSPERSSERDYVITDSVRSMCMYVGVSMYVYVCDNFLQN